MAPPPRSPGQTTGDRFELISLLGAGGFGEVWEAVDRQRDARVAAKRLWNLSADALLRFKREFRVRQDLDHPNLVHAGELVEDGGEWWLTMELVRGVPWVEHARAHPESVVGTARQLVGALVALHDRGLVHCDVKPSNVMVTEEGRAVLLDLGLARRIDVKRPTQSTNIFGTAAYVAPEQAIGDPIGPATDFYSLGVSLYEVLTSQLPFVGSSIQLVFKKRFERAVAPSALVPSLPPALSELVLALMDPEPTVRPDARTVMERLAQLDGDDTLEGEPLLRPFPSARMPFVGRGQELAGMRRALEAAQAGRFAFVHVGAESGLGKSALLQHFLTDLQDDRALVLTSRCFERESVPYNAFDGFIDALADAFAVLGPAETEKMVPSRAYLLTQIFPVLARVPGFQAFRVSGRLGTREDVVEVMQELVEKIAALRRLVLVVDDLQWADAESLALLERLFAREGRPSLLLVAASRPSDTLVPLVSNAIAAISAAADHVERIALGPLDDSAARELVEAVVDRRLEEETLARIVRGARGKPLFVAELAESVFVDASQLPTLSVEEAIALRARRLLPLEREVVTLLALANGPLPQGVVADAAGIEFTELSRLLVRLRAARFVRTDRVDSTLRVEIFHDRVRSAVLGDVHADDRPELQRRLAWAMRASGITGSIDLAYLFLEAGQIDEAAVELAGAAARAGASLAWSRAARLYFEALCLPAERPPEASCAMWVSLAQAYANGGEGILAARAFAQASTLAGGSDERSELERRAAHHFLRSGHVDEGMPYAERSLAAIGVRWPGTGRRATATMLLGRRRRRTPSATTTAFHSDVLRSVATPMVFCDLPIGGALQTDALAHARRLGDPRRTIETLCAQVWLELLLDAGRASTIDALLAEAQELAEREQLDACGGEPRLLAWLGLARGMALAFDGSLVSASLALEQAHRTLEERAVDVGFELAVTRVAILFVLLLRGELQEVRRRLRPFAHDTEQRGDLFGAVLLHTGFGYVAPLLDDRPDEAKHIVELTLRRSMYGGFDLGQLVGALAHLVIALYRSDPYGGIQLERRLADIQGLGWHRFRFVRIAVSVARALAALAGGAHGQREGKQAAERARREASWLLEQGILGRTVGRLVLASLLAAEGHVEQAVARLRDAQAELGASEYRLLAAAIDARLGLLVAGAEGSSLLEQARDYAREQGARRPDRWLAIFGVRGA